MILPLKSTPYETFQQLLDDYVNVYSRVEQGGDFTYINLFTHKHNLTTVVQSSTPHDVSILEPSSHFSGAYTVSEVSLKLVNLGHSNSKEYVRDILKRSRLHPNVSRLLQKTFSEGLVETQNWTLSADWQVKKKSLEAKFYKSAKKQVIDLLYECSNVSFILPEHMCYAYSRKMKDLKKPDVFVGAETFTNSSTAFGLSGDVPQYIFRRMDGSVEAGIWEWWKSIFLSKNQENRLWERPVLTKPAMSGSILLIFLVLFYGLGSCIGIFVIELGHRALSSWWRRKSSERNWENLNLNHGKGLNALQFILVATAP